MKSKKGMEMRVMVVMAILVMLLLVIVGTFGVDLNTTVQGIKNFFGTAVPDEIKPYEVDEVCLLGCSGLIDYFDGKSNIAQTREGLVSGYECYIAMESECTQKLSQSILFKIADAYLWDDILSSNPKARLDNVETILKSLPGGDDKTYLNALYLRKLDEFNVDAVGHYSSSLSGFSKVSLTDSQYAADAFFHLTELNIKFTDANRVLTHDLEISDFEENSQDSHKKERYEKAASTLEDFKKYKNEGGNKNYLAEADYYIDLLTSLLGEETFDYLKKQYEQTDDVGQKAEILRKILLRYSEKFSSKLIGVNLNAYNDFSDFVKNIDLSSDHTILGSVLESHYRVYFKLKDSDIPVGINLYDIRELAQQNYQKIETFISTELNAEIDFSKPEHKSFLENRLKDNPVIFGEAQYLKRFTGTGEKLYKEAQEFEKIGNVPQANQRYQEIVYNHPTSSLHTQAVEKYKQTAPEALRIEYNLKSNNILTQVNPLRPEVNGEFQGTYVQQMEIKTQLEELRDAFDQIRSDTFDLSYGVDYNTEELNQLRKRIDAIGDKLLNCGDWAYDPYKHSDLCEKESFEDLNTGCCFSAHWFNGVSCTPNYGESDCP